MRDKTDYMCIFKGSSTLLSVVLHALIKGRIKAK